MKVKAAITEIELDPEEMREYMLEAARELDEQFYEIIMRAPAYGDRFDAWEQELNSYMVMFDDSNDYVFADFVTSEAPFMGKAIVPVCVKWLELCGDNKIKPLLKECVENNVMLTWG